MPRRRSRCSSRHGTTGGSRAGRLDDGTVVSLAFVPEAELGDHLLVHLGVPVEVLEPADAAEALALRALDTGGPR